jgi:hypothetical protein
MRPLTLLVRAVLLLLLIGSCAAQPAPSSPDAAAPLSLEAYQRQLQDWSQQLSSLEQHPEQALQLRTAFPAKSVISEAGRSMEVSHSWLNTALGEFIAAKPERKPKLLRQMQAGLAAQGQEAALFSQPPAYPTSSRQKLSEILARREFRAVRGPTLWDQLIQRIQRWIIHWLDRIFRRVSYVPHGGQIVVWAVIGLAVILVVIWLRRAVQRQIIDWPREPIPFAPSQKHWRRWLAEAREAAQQGRWRDAIHLAYWAAISQLEQGGAWAPDRARTPREYLRLLPGSSEKRPILDALTRQFEIIWYGQHDAGADDFADTLVQLERLGCR